MTGMELVIPCYFDVIQGHFLSLQKRLFFGIPYIVLLTFPTASSVFFSWLRNKNWPQSFNEHWWMNLEIHDSPAQNEPSFPFLSVKNSNGTPWSPKLALNYFSFWVNEAPSALLTDKLISFQINLRKSYHISTPSFVITFNSRQAPKAD